MKEAVIIFERDALRTGGHKRPNKWAGLITFAILVYYRKYGVLIRICTGFFFSKPLPVRVPLQAVANSPPPGLTNLKENIGKQDTKAAGNQSILVKYVRTEKCIRLCERASFPAENCSYQCQRRSVIRRLRALPFEQEVFPVQRYACP